MSFKIGDKAKLLSTVEYDYGDDYLFIPAGIVGVITDILFEDLVEFDPIGHYREIVCFDYELAKIEEQ